MGTRSRRSEHLDRLRLEHAAPPGATRFDPPKLDEPPEEAEHVLPASPNGSLRRIWSSTLLVVFLGLSGAVLFLSSERNARRYYLVPNGASLSVMRGQFRPEGVEPYQPDRPGLIQAYAPLPIPAGAKVQQTSMFEERVELDEALADILLGWSRQLAAAGTSEAARECAYYLGRVERLAATTPEQERTRVVLGREVAFFIAREHLESGLASIREGMQSLKEGTLSTGVTAQSSRAALSHLEGEEAHLIGLLQWMEGLGDSVAPSGITPGVAGTKTATATAMLYPPATGIRR